jgi:hypothetical protein
MRRILSVILATGLCAGASGCIAVVKGGGGDSKPKPVATTPVAKRGTVEPIAVLDRKVELASQQVGLMTGDVGPMGPGFKAKRSVSFVEPPGVVESVACEVTSAQ